MNKRFKPQHLPHNDDAHALVEALAAELGLSLKGITGAKHKTILALGIPKLMSLSPL